MYHPIPVFATRPAAASAAPPSPEPVPRPAPGMAPGAPARPVAAPEALHPALWLAHQRGPSRQATLASGWAALDAELPGGGWPLGLLTELLLPAPGIGEMRLLAPALGALAAQGRCTMLFDPPAAPCAWALSQLGVPPERLLVVHGREGARGAAALRPLLPSHDLLWALEQSLRSGHVGAVLAWLPSRLKADALRRLQLAAQAHDGPAFLLRPIDERLKSSPAPLRLGLAPAGPDGLSVRVFKRRGPPLAQALRLALPPVLGGASVGRVAGAVPATGPAVVPAAQPVAAR
jgi:protein ImuA